MLHEEFLKRHFHVCGIRIVLIARDLYLEWLPRACARASSQGVCPNSWTDAVVGAKEPRKSFWVPSATYSNGKVGASWHSHALAKNGLPATGVRRCLMRAAEVLDAADRQHHGADPTRAK